MDGLIVINSVMLSNHIAGCDYRRVMGQAIIRRKERVAEIMVSHLRKSNGYKEPELVGGKGGHHPQD
jgi:hypothetical protein